MSSINPDNGLGEINGGQEVSHHQNTEQTYREVHRPRMDTVAMTTKEIIKAEIDNIDDRYLDELYSVIKDFVEDKIAPQEGNFMSRLKRIKINAPEDFSVNIDLYVRGEKRIE